MRTCEGVTVPVLVAGAGHAADEGAAEGDLPLEAGRAGLAELPGVARRTHALLYPARPRPWPRASRRELDLAQGQPACERGEQRENGMARPPTLLSPSCLGMLQTGVGDPNIPPGEPRGVHREEPAPAPTHPLQCLSSLRA